MKSKYALSEMQVENLARESSEATVAVERVGLTYLRVILVGLQAVTGGGKGYKPVRRLVNGTKAAHLEALEGVHKKFYAAVLRGVTTPDIAPKEGLPMAEQQARTLARNKRSNFARSAKSTLASFIRVGGDVRTLDPDTVTRDPLAAKVREKLGVSEPGYKIGRHVRGIARLVEHEACGDPEAARAELQKVIEELQATLDSLGEAEPAAEHPHTMTQVMRTRPAHARHKEARA